jgi:hypothetical protein
MANQDHLDILKQGVDVWNQWRKDHPDIQPNLSAAYLRETDLRRANFSHADLSEANLEGANLNKANLISANLGGANLRRADLRRAHFRGADLGGAYLDGADLRGAVLQASLYAAHLRGADLSGAHLPGADLSGASIIQTSFGDRDLRVIKGLDTVQHRGPSPLSINTIYLSEGNVPVAFLKGTGAPDTFIDYFKAILNLPIQYYSCFISYSNKDEIFARRLR